MYNPPIYFIQYANTFLSINDSLSTPDRGGFSRPFLPAFGDESCDSHWGDKSCNLRWGEESRDLRWGDKSRNLRWGEESRDLRWGDKSRNLRWGEESCDLRSGDESRDLCCSKLLLSSFCFSNLACKTFTVFWSCKN